MQRGLERERKEGGGTKLPPLLREFALWAVGLLAISTAVHLVAYFGLHKHGYPAYPLSWDRRDRFNDFGIFVEKFRYFGTTDFFRVGFPINYPAPVALVFELFFAVFGRAAVGAFVAFCVAAFAVPAALFARALERRGTRAGQARGLAAVMLVCSWPALLLIDGANAEVLVWLALLLATWAYCTGRGWMAAGWFGVAASLKLFPFVYLALFLSRRQWGKLVFGAAVFLAVSIASLWGLGPTIPVAFRGIAEGLARFKTHYMAQWLPGESGVDHSLWSLIKGLEVLLLHHGDSGFGRQLTVYLGVTAAGGVLLYALWIRRLPLVNQLLVLTVSMIYLTAFSGDGTLIHLYYPLALLMFLAIAAWRRGVVVPGLRLAMGAMVYLVSVESFWVWHLGHRFIGQTKCVALTVLLVAGLWYPFGPPLAQGVPESEMADPEVRWVGGAGGAG